MIVADIPVLYRCLSLLIGYAFGQILLGYILGKLSNVDIRTKGSGNVGTTNTTRILGKKKGALTLVCDVGKGLIAAGVCYLLFAQDGERLLAVYGAFGAVLGHDFPCYMGFKGGKGVATSLAFLGVVNPVVIPIALASFILVAVTTKYISLASIITDAVSVIILFFFGGLKEFSYNPIVQNEVRVMVGIAATILVIRHRENIGRLLRGEESKFSLSSKNKKES